MKLKRNRNDVVIGSKIGADTRQGKKDLDKLQILKAVAGSTRRLKNDYIDLHQTHCADESMPVEETLSAYADLIKSEKIRLIGAFNLSPERLVESLAASKTNELPPYQ